MYGVEVINVGGGDVFNVERRVGREVVKGIIGEGEG